MDNEIWKDIVGYEGKYQVSNMGRVKSLNYKYTGKAKILRPVKNNRCGYLFVNLCKNGNRKNYTVHRLILMTFSPVDNMDELDINHIDEDKTNNNLLNLEWGTHKENINHGTHNARVAEKLSIPISQLSLDGKLVKAWESSQDAERGGFNSGAIIQCCKNKYMRDGNNIYKSYRWMYLKDWLKEHNRGIPKKMYFID